MSKKSIIITNIIGVILIISVFISITYAYYTISIKNNSSDGFSAKLGNVDIIYSDDNSVLTINNIASGNIIGTKEFQVKSNAKESQQYTVIFENVKNTFANKSAITYTITCKINGSSNYCPNTSYTLNKSYAFPFSSSSNIVTTTINPGETHNYELTLKYESTAAIENKSISAKINISASPINDTLAYAIIKNATSCNGSDCTKFKWHTDTDVGTIAADNERELSIADDQWGTSYYFRGNLEDNFVTFARRCWRIVRIQGDGSIKLILYDDKNECQDSGEIPKSYITPYVEDSTTNRKYEASPGTIYGFTNSSSERLNFENFNYHIFPNKFTMFGVKYILDAWYKNFDQDQHIKNQISTQKWCIGNYDNTYKNTNSHDNYDGCSVFSGYRRLNIDYNGPRATYICDGQSVEMDVGLLTLDEVVFAGIGRVEDTYDAHSVLVQLHNNGTYLSSRSNWKYWWLLTPSKSCSGHDEVFAMPMNTWFEQKNFDPISFSVGPVSTSTDPDTSLYPAVRPSIVLNSSVKVYSPSNYDNYGSIDNPYVVIS